MSNLESFFLSLGERVLPRILSQICRDPGSPCFGSCDRNWWHYKIRDFSSIILQQAGYSIFIASQTPVGAQYGQKIQELAGATCLFWNKRAQSHGAFEEYYPFEQGYPPLAFSTLAVAKLCVHNVVPLIEIRSGLAIAVGQLMLRFEDKAANQQVAGLAALSVIRSLVSELVPETAFQQLLSRTLSLQKEEGWFPEYDGPDLGYLSVTMDCLWDIYDLTHDKRCVMAIEAAFDFLSWFVLGPFGAAGMHNARNTDYIVPYGIARLACEGGSKSALAMRVMEALFDCSNQRSHVLDAVDDRYWCHYIGHSVYRAMSILTSKTAYAYELPRSGSVDINELANAKNQSGHFLLGYKKNDAPVILVSSRKGAIFTALWPEGARVSDFGWVVEIGKKVYVSHWWSLDWAVAATDEEVACTGPMVAHKEHVSTPYKHMLLRVASFFVGRGLIRLLKKMVIFKQSNSALTFSRKVTWRHGSVVVLDKISGIGAKDKLIRAPRSSKRHVASADSFHVEDFALWQKVKMSVHVERAETCATIITKYQVDS